MANIDFIIEAIEKSLNIKSFDTKYLIRAIDEYYKSYSHKPHLGELPYDLNTNNPDELKERLDACKEGLKNAEKELMDKEKESESLGDKIDDNEQSIKELKDENEQLQKNVDHINETMGKVYEHFDDVAKEAEEFYDQNFDGWESDLLDPPSNYDNTYSEAFENVKEGMKNFKENIVPKGYIGEDDIAEIREIADNFEYLSGMQDFNYSDAMDEFIMGCQTMADDLNSYADNFNINGDTPFTKELSKREDGMSDRWYEVTARDEKKIESNNAKIDELEKDNEKLHGQKVDVDKDVRKLNTKVNDYSEHQAVIEEKIDSVSN